MLSTLTAREEVFLILALLLILSPMAIAILASFWRDHPACRPKPKPKPPEHKRHDLTPPEDDNP